MFIRNDLPLVVQILACPSNEPVASSVPSPCITATRSQAFHEIKNNYDLIYYLLYNFLVTNLPCFSEAGISLKNIERCMEKIEQKNRRG